MATALDLYQPFDAGAGANVTEDNWRKMARFWAGTGAIRGEDNDFLAYGDSSGKQVKVKTGKCFVRGHYGENTSEKTLAIADNASGNPRIDRVVLRADFTNNRIELAILQGTPAGSPTAPAVTQNSSIWETSLAQVAVANGFSTITAANVTDERDLVWPASVNRTLFARKTADESVTSSTTVQDDDHLFVQLEANSVYQFEMVLLPQGATGDFKFQFSSPSGATVFGSYLGYDAALTALAANYWDGTAVGVGAGVTTPTTARGTIITGANAGRLKLQWAQNTSSGSATTLLTNSHLSLRKVV